MATEMDELPEDTRSLKEQLAHCNGQDCSCAAFSSSECACDADWTPGEVYRLRAELAELKRKIAEAPIANVYSRRACVEDQYVLAIADDALELVGKRVALLPLDDGGEG